MQDCLRDLLYLSYLGSQVRFETVLNRDLDCI